MNARQGSLAAMPTNDSQPLPINCFLSYRRADNDVYRGVVDQLKSDLAGRFEAQTGRGLKIFVDRDDIGWGDDWRRKILDSIKRATFFIPVITMRYFDSEPCRDEFTAFYEDAKRIGVTGLIRPVILAGADRVAEDSLNEQMRVLARLNYVSIEQEFDEGFNSPQWHKVIKYMVGQLAQGIEEAETVLQTRELTSAKRSDDSGVAGKPDEEYADLQDMQRRIEGLDEYMDAMKLDLQTVMEAIGPVLDSSFWDLPKKRQQVMVLSAAKALRQPATKFADSSAAFEAEAVALESGMRLALDEVGSMESEVGREIYDSLIAASGPSTDSGEFAATMAPVIDGLRILGMLNINMRKASQPVLRGIQSVKRAAEAFESLSQLGSRDDPR